MVTNSRRNMTPGETSCVRQALQPLGLPVPTGGFVSETTFVDGGRTNTTVGVQLENGTTFQATEALSGAIVAAPPVPSYGAPPLGLESSVDGPTPNTQAAEKIMNCVKKPARVGTGPRSSSPSV